MVEHNPNNKFDVHVDAHEDVEIIRKLVDEHGILPENLVELTNMVVAIHRANGDLAWLADVVRDAENKREMNNYDVNDYLP